MGDGKPTLRVSVGVFALTSAPGRGKESQMETCTMCGRTIGNAETPYVWQEASVVCAECWRALAAAAAIAQKDRAEAQSTPTEPTPPPRQQEPLRVARFPGPRPAWQLYSGAVLWATIFDDAPGTIYREPSMSSEDFAAVKDLFCEHVRFRRSEAAARPGTATAQSDAYLGLAAALLGMQLGQWNPH